MSRPLFILIIATRRSVRR